MLSNIHIKQEDFESVVRNCDALLKILKMDRQIVIHSLADIAALYIRIGKGIAETDQHPIARWAYDAALLLSDKALVLLKQT